MDIPDRIVTRLELRRNTGEGQKSKVTRRSTFNF
jgi:hypothetical protein